MKTRARARVHARRYDLAYIRIPSHRAEHGTFEHGPLTEDIGVLSYPFYHNNSPTYKYTRIYVCTEVGYVGWKVPVQLRPLHPPPPRPPSPSTTSLLFFSFYSPPFCRWSVSRFPSACRTAVKQTLVCSPPLTSRIKPFNCRIVFDGSFSPVKLLFKLRDDTRAGSLLSQTDATALASSVSPLSILIVYGFEMFFFFLLFGFCIYIAGNSKT